MLVIKGKVVDRPEHRQALVGGLTGPLAAVHRTLDACPPTLHIAPLESHEWQPTKVGVREFQRDGSRRGSPRSSGVAPLRPVLFLRRKKLTPDVIRERPRRDKRPRRGPAFGSGTLSNDPLHGHATASGFPLEIAEEAEAGRSIGQGWGTATGAHLSPRTQKRGVSERDSPSLPAPRESCFCKWWTLQDLNLRPPACEAAWEASPLVSSLPMSSQYITHKPCLRWRFLRTVPAYATEMACAH